MLSKREIKDIQSLSHKKFREALKLFVAEGPKIVGELLLAAPHQVRQVYATAGWIAQQKDTSFFTLTEVSEAELERISHLQTPHEVLALVEMFPETAPAESGFLLYLDTIQDPGNFGTILRIADWFALEGVVCSAGCADRYNPKVVQSTMASIARVPVHYDADGHWLSAQHRPVYAAALEGEPLYGMKKTGEGILVIGNESRGIHAKLLEKATKKITIPRRGEAESLNAAVATGIILSHLLS